MPPTVVPSSTPVRRSRVGNVDTDRLTRRRDYLVTVGLPGLLSGDCSRSDYSNRVGELTLIEDCLDDRGVVYTRRTMPKVLRGRYLVSTVTGSSTLVGPSPKHYRDAGK